MISIYKFIMALFKRKKSMRIKSEENSRFFQMLIDTIPNPIFYKDEEGVYRHCNTALIEYLGLKREEIVDHTVYEVYPKELADIYYEADHELIKNKGTQIYEAKMRYHDGSYRDVLFNKAVYVDKKGEAKGLVGVMVDITERKIFENKINRLLKLKEAMLEVNQGIIGTKNIQELFDLILEKVIGSIEHAHYGSVLILDEEENLKIAVCKGYEEENAKNFCVSLKNSFVWRETNGKLDKTVIVNHMDKTDDLTILDTEEGFKIKSSISAPIILEGKLYGFVNVDSRHKDAFDETDLDMMEYMRNQIEMAISKHKLYEESIYLSRYDKLTNIYNRRHFEEVVCGYISKKEDCNEAFLLVIFDLNGLKFVNDTYGHLAGDELIKTFASLLANRIRSSDVLARFGGDEFIGVFFEMDDQKLIVRLEELRHDLKDHPIIFEGKHIFCSFSYGISKFPHDSRKYKELVKIADGRMYAYKQKIKNEK